MTNKELSEKVNELEKIVKKLVDVCSGFAQKYVDFAKKFITEFYEQQKHQEQPQHHNFKVGDRVQFKSWEEMVKEFGLDEYGEINNDNTGFVDCMRHLGGTYATIEKIKGEDVKLKDFTAEGETDWLYDIYMLKPATYESCWTFTDDERIILGSLHKRFRWLARDKDGSLYIYTGKPIKIDDIWEAEDSNNAYCFDVFKSMFKAIKWEDTEPCEFRKFI